jgi:hypothetical protein
MSSDTDSAHRVDPALQIQASEELSLLGDDPASGLDLSDTDHSLRTAPIFTGDALRAVGCGVFPQRASYGRIISQHVEGFASATQSPSLYINTNAPFSALVCGVQVRHQPYTFKILKPISALSIGLGQESHDFCAIRELSHSGPSVRHAASSPLWPHVGCWPPHSIYQRALD